MTEIDYEQLFEAEELQNFVYSETISKSKTFNTEEEAKTWREAEIKALKEKGFDTFDSSVESGFMPPYEKMVDGRYVAYVEAEYFEWEEVTTESTA